MGAVDYLINVGDDLKTLLESDSELVGYAATPYSLTDELVRVKKKYNTVSIELHNISEGDTIICGKSEMVLEFRIRTYTKYTSEANSRTYNLQMAGRIIEILKAQSNMDFSTGVYRVDIDVDFEYETAISNKGKISRASEITAYVYLQE